MRVDTLTPVLDAAPGELIIGRVRVVNDGPDDASFTMRVVGLDGNGVVLVVPGGPVAPGLSADVDVPLDVPAALGVGHHAVALEVSSDRPDERPALAQLTVAIDSLERVQMVPRPSTVRAGRNGRFTLDVVNHESATVDVALAGEAADVQVRFDPPSIRLHPGERGWVRGRIRARQRWGGESIHHVLTLTARGRSSANSTTLAYIQRPLVPGRARNAVAALVVIALFLGAVGGGLWWWNQRDTTEVASDDAVGNDGTLDPLEGTSPGSPDGSPGAGAGGDSDGDGSGGGGAAGPGAIPTFTIVNGTVSTSGGDPSGVSVRMAPIELGARVADDARIVGVAGRSRPAKIWSARHAVRPSPVSAVRQSESVLPVTTDGEGVWRFVDVPIRQNYELVFAKPGYDTQSFVVTPPEDGSPVELDVELEAGVGVLSGVVVGPAGALGGVDLTLTDGTLTFRTTSATEASGAGQVGGFTIEGLSTPAVYTLTAALDGYGTEVLQLPFTAGQQRSGVTVSMRDGVGSISGRVTVAGEARGGVTVRASNGDATFTTTSLTEGDVGSYSIPRLTIPGEYTVTVTLDGYITQTRRVQLAGNASGVDFQLVPTTAGISGRVMSSNGNPIVGAGITVSVDDVGFRSSTAAAPVAGSFNIDDLPPGTYLVRIARFDHLPFSEQVTVGAGQTVDLGTITLEFTERPPIAALGSIAVRVFDSEDADLTGATVSIYALDARVGSDPPLRTASDTEGDQSTFVFENVPIGTYRVRVTRPIYRTVERRVSVGLGRENVDVRMLRLGQASGQIVTADGRPLRDYEIRIVRIDGPGVETEVERRTVVGGAQPDDDGRIEWSSSPNSLITGLYRLEITRQPPGYHVQPNQVIDPTVTVAPAAMLFRVPADSEEPVVVDDLVADPYPLLGGKVFVPHYTEAAATTTMRELDRGNIADAAVLDDLEVTLTCGAASAPAAVPPGPRDVVRPYPGFALADPESHFELTPFLLQAQQLTGDCRLDVTADGFLPVSVALSNPIATTPGEGDPRQRTVNVALLHAADPFFGNVFWLDGSTRIPVAGATISSDPLTVIGARPRQGDEQIDAAPAIRRGVLATTSDGAGAWQLDGQLFGAATYTFVADNFTSGTLRAILADETDPAQRPTRVIEDGDNLTSTERLDGGLDVELTNPDPGTLRGTIEILTKRSTPDFDGVGRRGDGPGNQIVTEIPYLSGTGNPRTFELSPASAGTWTVTFTEPTNHAFFANAPAEVEDRVLPGTTVSEFDTRLVELGIVAMSVAYAPTVDADGEEIDEPNADEAKYELVGPPGFATRPGTSDSERFAELIVDPVDPLENDVRYDLSVTRNGYDEADATVEIWDRTEPNSPQRLTAPGGDAMSSGPDDPIVLQLRAGNELDVVVTLPQYGTITGTVLDEFTSDVLQLPAGPGDEGLEIDARRVTDADGVAVVPADQTTGVVVRPGDDPGTSFTLAGPPGTYSIEVSHPEFASTPLARPYVVPGDPSSGPKIFVNQNTVRTKLDEPAQNPWQLRVLRSMVSIDVLGSFDVSDPTRRAPVADARVTLRRNGDVVADLPTDDQGRLDVSYLLPGLYQLEVRRFGSFVDGDCAGTLDPRPEVGDDEDEPLDCYISGGTWSGLDTAYPVIATITVPPGRSLADRTIELTVTVPSLTASLYGTVKAVNSLGVGIDVPPDSTRVAVPDGVTITREYQPMAVDVVGGGTIVNDAEDSDLPGVGLTSSAVPVGNDIERTFAFDPIPGGTNVFTVEYADGVLPPEYVAPPGYTLSESQRQRSITVDDVDDVDEDRRDIEVVFVAQDVDLVVELDYGAFGGRRPDAVRLTSDAAGTELVRTGVAVDDDEEVATYRFAAVPPRRADYYVFVDDALFAPADGSSVAVEVVPNGDGDPRPATEPPVQTRPIEMVGELAVIGGEVRQQDTASGTPGALQAPADVVLRRAGTEVQRLRYVPAADPGNHPDAIVQPSISSYEFTVADAGDYSVVVEKAGYTTNVAAAPGVVLGDEVSPTPDLLAVRNSTVTVVAADATEVVAYGVSGATDGAGGIGDRDPIAGVEQPAGTWTFSLPPGGQYRFQASAPGRYTEILPPASAPPAVPAPFAATIGGAQTYTRSLVARTVTVNVGVAGVPDGVVVTVALPFAEVQQQEQTTSSAAGSTLAFTFTSIDATGALPLTGGGDITVAANGYRTWTLDLPAITSTVGAPANAAVTHSVTLRPVVTTIEATIAGLDEDDPVTVHASDGQTVRSSQPDTGNGTYSIPGPFAPGTWTVYVDRPGFYGASTTVTITSDAPAGTTAIAPVLSPQPRQVAITFNVPAPSAGSVVRHFTTVVDDVAVAEQEVVRVWTTPEPGGVVTFNQPETYFAGDGMTYEVRIDGRIWPAQRTFTTADLTSDRGTLSLEPTNWAYGSAYPEFTGRVIDGNAGQVGLTVERRAGPCPAAPGGLTGEVLASTTTRDASGNSPGTGSFTLPPARGGPTTVNCISVQSATKWARVEVTSATAPALGDLSLVTP